MRILFLSRWFPYPADNGAKLRIYNILRQLSQEHQIVLLTFRGEHEALDAEALVALKRVCTVVRSLPYRPFEPGSRRALLGFLQAAPRSLVDTYSADMHAAILEEHARRPADLIVASELDMAPYVQALPGVPAVLEDLELGVYHDAARLREVGPRGVRPLLTWLKLSLYLRRTLPRFAACTVVSETERALVRQSAPGYPAVEMVPNAVDLGHYKGNFGASRPNTLVFAGALTYGANLDALRYFLSEVYPLVREVVPDVVLRVTGRTEGVDLATLPRQPGVEYVGHVPDIRPVVARSWASVVPLRVGGGTRLKILESLALGTPVVATPKGAEGLDVVDGDSILLADTPVELAARLVTLLQSSALRDRLSVGGSLLVAARYDWARVGADLRAIVARAATRQVDDARLAAAVAR